MESLNKKTIKELLDILGAGVCLPADIVSDLLAVIDKDDNKVGAYISLNRDQILKDAESSYLNSSENKAGLLSGIPISIKDLINVEDDSWSVLLKY